MKHSAPTAEDELRVLERALKRKRPRHSGGSDEAETRSRAGGG